MQSSILFSLRSLALALASTALLACSSSPPAKRAPVIDDLELPDAVASSSGTYVISGKISYHDDDELVTGLKVRFTATGQSTTVAVQASSKVEGLPIQLTLSGAAPKGSLAYEISVTSASGIDSPVLQKTINLE